MAAMKFFRRALRLLVLRPEPDATFFAEQLRRLGHEPIVSPLSRIAALNAGEPDLEPDLVIATSVNAIRCASTSWLSGLVNLPLFAVGPQTALAARMAGFTNLRIGEGDGLALGDLIAAQMPAPRKILYLAGRPRKAALEMALVKAGYEVSAIELYEAQSIEKLPPAMSKALTDGVDAIFHFSRASAETFLHLVSAAGLTDAARVPLQLCLSPDVAMAFRGGGWRIETAKSPVASSLLDLLDRGAHLSHTTDKC